MSASRSEIKAEKMKTIAVVSQKGGAGKTTIAVNLAIAAEQRGLHCAIVDLDPQSSARSWHDIRRKESPVVISSHSSRLPHILETARESGAGLVILDTAPHSETVALSAARAADLVLIPCRPSVFDLRAIATSVDLASLAQTPAVVVLNGVPSRGVLAAEATTAITGYGVDMAPDTLGHRAAFVHSLTVGLSVLEYEPASKAAEEILAVFRWLCSRLGIN
ncbi:MAG: AAA family ATPase [Chlorobiales bacterium]|nr:AAA family ATPase [Chlorobiales bacterium]